ncbi:conjugal transfer protein TraX [Paenibacillus tyrfis]|nr:conjugal transfer protein TraX [Paenibacillus tyrfis]
MFADHTGKIFFPDVILWQLIGRMAFPIYCYFIVIGYQRTSNLNKYFSRLFLLGLVSQIPYMLALRVQGINAIGTLFLSLAVLYALDQIKSKGLKAGIVILGGFLLEFLTFDYGSYGLLLVLIFRYTKGHKMVGAHYLLNIAFLFYKGWLLQLASVVISAVIAYTPSLIRWTERVRVPRWLWRSFYPAHFVFLFLLALLVQKS